MTALIDAFVVLLRAALTEPVEKYWRLNTPSTLTVFCQPSNQGAETGWAIGNTFRDFFTLDCYVETPWDDSEATAEAVDAVVVTIRGVVSANRDILTADVGTVTGATWFMAQRDAASDPVFGVKVSVQYRG